MTTEQPSAFENLRAKINSRLEKAKIEIEELSLQFNLGKADASDKFESIKKDFHSKVNEWKLMGEQLKPIGKEKLEILKTKLEELQVQLALGKAEAKDLFQEQKKKIMQSITELEAEVRRKV